MLRIRKLPEKLFGIHRYYQLLLKSRIQVQDISWHLARIKNDFIVILLFVNSIEFIFYSSRLSIIKSSSFNIIFWIWTVSNLLSIIDAECYAILHDKVCITLKHPVPFSVTLPTTSLAEGVRKVSRYPWITAWVKK